MEKKFISLSAFKEYDKKLKEYIGMKDGLYCPECGEIIIGDKCENCENCEEDE